jgi:hypothetical protein
MGKYFAGRHAAHDPISGAGARILDADGSVA